MTPPRRGNPSGGEQVDRAVEDSVRLAHRALERFPDLVRRHKFIAGGAAISSSLIVLAGVAIARRMLAGASPEEAVAAVTEDEVQGIRPAEPETDDPQADEVGAVDGKVAQGTSTATEPTPIGVPTRTSIPTSNGHTAGVPAGSSGNEAAPERGA